MIKTVIKIASLILICCMLALSLVSCGISMSEGKSHVEGFLAAISDEDFEKAATYMHPDVPADVKAVFEELETKWSIDLKNGVTVEKYTGFQSSLHNSEVDGSVLSFSMKLKLDTATAAAEVILVENDSGFGIYNFRVGSKD